jgi:hypothetical protein
VEVVDLSLLVEDGHIDTHHNPGEKVPQKDAEGDFPRLTEG